MSECPITWCYMFVLVMVCFGLSVSAREGNLQEICMSENFQAECPDGNVVMIFSALYGRMHVGRCARQGNIGCVADAVVYLDIKCSGRQRCDFLTPDENLVALNPCPTDYQPYLEAVYSCVSVLSDPILLSQCQNSGLIVLSGMTEGNIASSVIQSTRLGTQICPWVIEADPGQRINVTLIDFGTQSTEVSGATCDIYATITERTSPSATMICNGAVRERVVYLSSTPHIEIKFIDTVEMEVNSQFLLQFSVIGCQDPPLNGNALKQRTFDKAILHCQATGEEQIIYCRGRSWDPLVVECVGSHWNIFSSGWESPQGIWVVLGIGIAIGIVVGLGLLFCGVLCFKRFNRRQDLSTDDYPYGSHVGHQTKTAFYTTKNEPYGEMNYATYDRGASAAQEPYMHAVNPVNRDVMLIETMGTLTYKSTPTTAKEHVSIKYMDQEEPAYEKPI